MPPKVKITKDNIIKAAIDIVRAGESSVNARSVAAALNCSTQPVFSNFESMEELQLAVAEEAYRIYLGFLKKETESGKYPAYKSFGMAYIRFAKEEKELFKLLFMCDREGKEPSHTEDFEASVEMIMKANNLSRERAELFHLEMWTYVHGIAVMLATSYLNLDWDTISLTVSDVYQGLRKTHLSEE